MTGPTIFDLPKVNDKRGNLSFIENRKEIPFDIARTYWIYDVPGGQRRGSHAFKTQKEVIVALSGSFDVVLHDGKKQKTYHLNRSYKALYVPEMTWRVLDNFSTNSICLVLSSGSYQETEYIRNFKEFKRLRNLNQAFHPEPPSFVRHVADKKELGLQSSVFDCSLIEFPVIKNRAGSITSITNSVEVPFDIPRVFYVYDIPYGEVRGVHSHKKCHQILIAASGSFDVELDDGTKRRIITLNRPTYGLHIPPGIWATQRNYSSGTICLVLTSDVYDEQQDYIREYSAFKKYKEKE
ncbi:MAG: putative WxcM-like protein [Bacteroidetes bacterium]|nr:putative WxcM-like protein [Bacteroidota bacterium]